MLKRVRTIRGEGGFVLVTSMLIMMLASVVGIVAINTSSLEMQIAGINKFHQMTFAGADSGIYGTTKIIRETLKNNAAPTNPVLTVSDDFLETLKGFVDVPVPPEGEEPVIDDDLAFDLTGTYEIEGVQLNYTAGQINVNIVRSEKAPVMAGFGAEFASGAGGTGQQVPQAAQFNINSLAEGESNSSSNIVATYLHIQGAGGL